MQNESSDIFCSLIYVVKEISPLFTFLAIIVAWLTLREISKQRKESYKPRLMLQDKNFCLKKNSNGTPNTIEETTIGSEPDDSTEFKFELRNIGLGAAHGIRIKWIYDHKKIYDLFKLYAFQTGLLKVNDNNHFEYMFDRQSRNGFGFFIKTPNQETTQIAFLSNNESLGIKIPETVKNYITFIPYLILVSKGNPRRIEAELDDIIIEFKFLDIGGKRQNQKLTMRIELYAYSKEFDGNKFGIGSFNFASHKPRLLSFRGKGDIL